MLIVLLECQTTMLLLMFMMTYLIINESLKRTICKTNSDNINKKPKHLNETYIKGNSTFTQLMNDVTYIIIVYITILEDVQYSCRHRYIMRIVAFERQKKTKMQLFYNIVLLMRTLEMANINI